MKKLRAVLCAMTCGAAAASAAQGPLSQPGFVAGGPAAVRDVTPAVHHAGGASPFVNAHGDPFVSPAQHCQSCPPGGGYGGYPGGGYPGGGGIDPFGGAVFNTPQSGPHYFDISGEFVRYQRDSSPFGDGVISRFGFANEDLSNLGDQTALSTGQLDSGDLNGFRLTGRLDLGALSVVEFSYTGLYGEEQSAFAEVTDPNSNERLFSVFSRFGTRTNGASADTTPGVPRNLVGANFATVANPANSVNPDDNNPGGLNFRQTDFATRHEVTFDQDLQTAEASYRRYWVGFNPRVSGTILLGFRYTQLTENAGFVSIGTAFVETDPAAPAGPFAADPNQTLAIASESINSLAGFQVGADAWVNVVQGLRVGGEGKVGIYGNDYEVTNAVSGQTGSTIEDTQVAFLTEWKLSAVADLTPSLSIRGGYELLYISELALAGDSLLNTPVVAGDTGVTTSPLNTGDEVFFHGFHVGAEYIW